MKQLAALALLGLAACSPAPQVRELSNPSVNALMALPIPQFFATLRLSSRLASDCPAFDYDSRAAEAISAARTRGRTYEAAQNAIPIDIESDVTLRSFEAKHAGASACTAAEIEFEEQTAVSAVLVRR